MKCVTNRQSIDHPDGDDSEHLEKLNYVDPDDHLDLEWVGHPYLNMSKLFS